MPHYRLTYFNAKARAEITRTLFKAARVEFEDVRINFSDWKALKPSTPFGQLPMLEVDGVKLAQSHSIEMYVAKQFGLVGASAMEEAKVDSYLCTFSEIAQSFMEAHFEKDESRKESKQKSAVERADQVLAVIEKTLKGQKFLVNEMTAADISLTVWLNSFAMAEYFESVKDNYPEISALVQRINDVPEIKAWIQTRPVTER